MTVPRTCHSGHAVLPGELYCPACGECLLVAATARVDASTPGVASSGYWAPPFAPQAGHRPLPRTSGWAVASLLLGLCWLWWVGSVLAVVCGHLALRDAHQQGRPASVVAVAGTLVGWVGIGALAIVIFGHLVVT